MSDQPQTIVRADSAVGEVALRRRCPASGPAVTELIVNGAFVMDTVDVSTEIELAHLALDRHPSPRRVLIGGLGLGFTARAILDDPRVEQLTVAEIAAPLVDWAHAGLLPNDLGEHRIHLVVGDVADHLRTGKWDAILLDVDNGPGFLVRAENAELYARAGLGAAAAALAPGGILAIWSSHLAPELAEALRSLEVGSVDEVVREIQREGRSFDYATYVLSRAGE